MHVGVLVGTPNLVEIRAAKVSKVAFDGGVVKDFVDSSSAPVGFENEAVGEIVSFLKVEADA